MKSNKTKPIKTPPPALANKFDDERCAPRKQMREVYRQRQTSSQRAPAVRFRGKVQKGAEPLSGATGIQRGLRKWPPGPPEGAPAGEAVVPAGTKSPLPAFSYFYKVKSEE